MLLVVENFLRCAVTFPIGELGENTRENVSTHADCVCSSTNGYKSQIAIHICQRIKNTSPRSLRNVSQIHLLMDGTGVIIDI